jgi:hypothetical protein
MEDVLHSYSGTPHMRQCVCMEAVKQDSTEPHSYLQQSQWDTGYEGGYLEYQGCSSSYYPHGSFGLSHGAETSTPAWYPDWYYPLERYITYGADQAQWVVEGVGQLNRTVGELRSSIDSQTDMTNSLFGRLGFDPNT